MGFKTASTENRAIVLAWWWGTTFKWPEEMNLLYMQSLSFGHIVNPSKYIMQLGETHVASSPVLSALEILGLGRCLWASKKRKEMVCGKNSINIC